MGFLEFCNPKIQEVKVTYETIIQKNICLYVQWLWKNLEKRVLKLFTFEPSAIKIISLAPYVQGIQE